MLHNFPKTEPGRHDINHSFLRVLQPIITSSLPLIHEFLKQSMSKTAVSNWRMPILSEAVCLLHSIMNFLPQQCQTFLAGLQTSPDQSFSKTCCMGWMNRCCLQICVSSHFTYASSRHSKRATCFAKTIRWNFLLRKRVQNIRTYRWENMARSNCNSSDYCITQMVTN